MIQRIQTLLLIAAVILFIANLFVPIWTNTQVGGAIVLNAFSVSQYTPKGLLEGTVLIKKGVYYVGVLIILCIPLTLYIIMQFKNRKLQIKLCHLLTLFTLMIIGSYFIAIPAAKSIMIISSDGEYEIGYFLPILNVLLIQAARYYINKDEELVRSVDRIR